MGVPFAEPVAEAAAATDAVLRARIIRPSGILPGEVARLAAPKVARLAGWP